MACMGMSLGMFLGLHLSSRMSSEVGVYYVNIKSVYFEVTTSASSSFSFKAQIDTWRKANNNPR
jgi:hypothetical protein